MLKLSIGLLMLTLPSAVFSQVGRTSYLDGDGINIVLLDTTQLDAPIDYSFFVKNIKASQFFPKISNEENVEVHIYKVEKTKGTNEFFIKVLKFNQDNLDDKPLKYSYYTLTTFKKAGEYAVRILRFYIHSKNLDE